MGTTVADIYIPATGEDGSIWVDPVDANFERIARDNTVFTLTDAATVLVDATTGQFQKAALTANRTIDAPTNPTSGMVLTFDIQNSKGSSMTTTWNAIYKLAGAWTDPANTKRRTITYYYDGTNWVEVSRGAADI